MTASSIQHTRKGRHYRTPILLDQRNMVRIGIVLSLFLVVIFMSGYVIGFQKAEARLDTPLTQLALSLPEPVLAAVQEIEPEIPQRVAPGENIDVDSADESGMARHTDIAIGHQVHVSMKQAGDDKKPATEDGLTVTASDAAASTGIPLGVGGPALSDPGQDDGPRHPALYDTASQEMARYSIQVGMYSQLENAERKVSELISAELNAYFDAYLNGKNETRYSVRFGYFANHHSAREALQVYQREMGGSGYIVNLQTTVAAR